MRVRADPCCLYEKHWPLPTLLLILNKIERGEVITVKPRRKKRKPLTKKGR